MKTSAPMLRQNIMKNLGRWFSLSLSLIFAFTALIPAVTLQAQGSSLRVESFPLRPNGEVRIENARGSTTVEVWDSRTVRIVAEKVAKQNSAIQPSELALMSAQNTVLIECKESAQPARLNLMVYVPRFTHLQIMGGSWPVEVSGSLASSVVETTSGNVTYKMPGNDNARVAMRSARGLVKSSVPLVISQRDGTRSLQGQLGGGANEVFVNSQSGNISLLPAANLVNAVASVSSPSDPANSQAVNQGNDSAPFDRQPGSSPRPSQTNRDDAMSRGARSAGDEEDSNSIANSPYVRAPQTNSQPSAGYPPAPAPPAGNGGINIGGAGRDSDNSTTAKSGPLSRERKQQEESVGSAGLSVRIIPAYPPSGGTRAQNPSVYADDTRYQNPDQSQNQQNPAPSRGYGNSRQQSAQDDQSIYPDSRSPRDGRDTQYGSSTNAPRPTAPPVLHRNRDAEPSAEPSAEPKKNADGEEDDTITLNTALVNLNVSAMLRSGSSVANLKKEDFEVYENGEAQEVEFFAPTNAPFNLVLVLDLSGSIKDKIDVVKSAALRFIDAVSSQDKVAVVTFTDQVRVISQLTNNHDVLKKRVKAIERSDGGTAFYEAMWFSLVDTLRGTRGQRNAIVVMTDGVDSSLDRYDPAPTRVSYDQLAAKFEEADALVFPIYLDTEYDEVFNVGYSKAEAYAVARVQLERLAELTGGQKFEAQQASDLSGVYKQVAAALRTIYSVGYYPKNPERDGTYRRVQVKVKRGDVAVRTRRGYYAK